MYGYNPANNEFPTQRTRDQRWMTIYVPILLFLTIGHLWPSTAVAVDSSQLWLPRNYYRHYKKLMKAAEVAEQTQMCRFVIAGTVHQSRSTEQHPVFKITCRDDERKTFAFLVDGFDYEILNRPAPDPKELERQALQLRLEGLWLQCDDQLQQRTAGLRGVSWLNKGDSIRDIPEAQLNGDDDVTYEVLFNAAGQNGRILQYRGTCHFKGEEKTINIHARLDRPPTPEEATTLADEAIEQEVEATDAPDSSD